MNRKISLVSTFLFIAIFTISFALKNGEYYNLTILHTNDIHGNLENLPEYSTIVKQERSNIKNLLVLDGGDIYARGKFAKFNGIPEMEVINNIGYDAWVLGNNDFRIPIDKKLPANDSKLENLVKTSKQPTLCANVIYKKNGRLLDGVKPYIIKKIDGVKIGIIGLTSMKPQVRGYEPDKIFLDATETLKALLKELKGKTDVNIVLSHCGLAVDTKLANIEGIDAVLGADDHFHMSKPIYWVSSNQKSTPIVQHGGEEDHVLGKLELIFLKENGELKLVDFRGSEYDIKFVEEDKNIRNIINKYEEKLSLN